MSFHAQGSGWNAKEKPRCISRIDRPGFVASFRRSRIIFTWKRIWSAVSYTTLWAIGTGKPDVGANWFSSRVDGKEKCMITGGVYPFSLTLPENLPCSFEGRYGRVRYSIRALLDVTTIYRFSTNIIPFTVAPILDLNRDPLATVSRNLTTNDIAFAMWFRSRDAMRFRINARFCAHPSCSREYDPV